LSLWRARAIQILRHDLRTKIILGAAVGIVCAIMYRALQQFPIYPVKMHADCTTWHYLPFNAGWTWPYLSMLVMVSLAWLFLPGVEEARRCARYFPGVAAVGWLAFFSYPTGCIRPQLESPSWLYHVLVSVDAPTNCLPCLHAAFSVLAGTALAARGRVLGPLSGRLFVTIWVAIITVSIVAVHQHTDVDVLGGAFTGRDSSLGLCAA
jgi:hypothetical protein